MSQESFWATAAAGRNQYMALAEAKSLERGRVRLRSLPPRRVERRMRFSLSTSRSEATAAASGSKKEKPGKRRYVQDDDDCVSRTWSLPQHFDARGAGGEHRERGDKWTVTCSDEAKPLCKSPNFRNTSPSFGTHSPLNSRLWVMAIPSPLLSFFSPLARRQSRCTGHFSPNLSFLRWSD